MISVEELQRRLAKPRPGRAILFTGAGFSTGAINREGRPIPLARKFAAQLAKEIGEPSDISLTVISELYNERKGDERALLELLKKEFSAKNITEAQGQILRYPWKRIYTTNYDNVMEFARSPDGSIPDSFTRDRMPLNFESPTRQIIHLNGFVGDLSSTTEVDDFALTLSSYIDKSLFSSPWATTFRQDCDLADLIVFVGYSLSDTDITNILGRNPELRDKTVAIQWDLLSTSEEKFLARFGSVLKIGGEGLAEVVRKTLLDGEPTVSVSGPENFQEIILPSSPIPRTPSDRDVDALLVRGIYDRGLFYASKLLGERPYLAERADAKLIAAGIAKAGTQCVIHSNFGNGKTLLLEQLMFEMVSKQRLRVFLFDRRTDNFSYDVEFLSKVEEPYALIIEELIANDDVIEAVVSQLSKAIVVVTARTSAFEVKTSDVRHLFSSETAVFDANRLHDDDIASLIRILDSGAYWARFENVRTLGDKTKFIEKKCKRELGSVLLGVVGSQILDERIRRLFQERNPSKERAKRTLILALALNFVEMRPTYAFLSELLGMDVFGVMSSFQDDEVRQFFAIAGTEIVARSPIMSEYILQNFVSDDALLDVVYEAVKHGSERHKRAKRYRELNSKFMQFSFIDRIISSTNNRYDRIQEFYDRAGEIGFKEFSPHYWLQYAIAARAYRDYKSADRFFAQSRKIAQRRSDFYTYKVDNSFAQFLLESRRDVDVWADFFEVFLEASTLAQQQTKMQRTGFYPYKVVSLFDSFLAARARNFTKKQKQDALEICLAWIRRIDQLPKATARNHLVRQARASANNSYDLLTEMLS